MKFFLSSGEHLGRRLLDFSFVREFASSRLLVVCTSDDGNMVAACGIRGLLNTLVLYVKESYRSRGIGAQILSKTIQIAERRKLDFVTLSVSSGNIVAFRLYKRAGFQEVLTVRKSGKILMMLPLTFAGKLAYDVFHAIRFLLPNTFLFYVHTWLYGRTL